MRTRWMVPAFTFAVVATSFGMAAWGQQAPTVKRDVVRKQDTHAPGLEGVMAKVEISPGGREGRHIHPSADVFAYVAEGTMTLEVQGRPTVTLEPGDSFFIEAGKTHEGIGTASDPVKLIAVFVNEKGKPLTAQVQ